MRSETQKVVGSIYARVLKQQCSATEARNKAVNEKERLMLAGKVKAYTDMLCLLKDRYGSKTKLPPVPTTAWSATQSGAIGDDQPKP